MYKSNKYCSTSFFASIQLNCKDKIEEIGDLPLKKIVESLGGWPVTNKSWVKSDSKLEQLLAKVRAEYHLGVIFEVFVTIDDRNSSANILQVSRL